MRIIGITGGVGSGKSRVLAFLKSEYEAFVCQADHVAWQLQRPGAVCYKRIVQTFGTDILCEDGNIDRARLGAIVFSDKHKLHALNEIMHPEVKRCIREEIALQTLNGVKLFVLEAALLLEEHYDEICDELWYIYTDDVTRRIRLKTDRAYTDEKIDAIMTSQVSDEAFRKGCQRVIDNSGAFDETCAQIRSILSN